QHEDRFISVLPALLDASLDKFAANTIVLEFTTDGERAQPGAAKSCEGFLNRYRREHDVSGDFAAANGDQRNQGLIVSAEQIHKSGFGRPKKRLRMNFSNRFQIFTRLRS